MSKDEREKERETDRQRERETDRQIETEREKCDRKKSLSFYSNAVKWSGFS